MLETFMDKFARPLWDKLDAILKAVTKPEVYSDEYTRAADAGRLAEHQFIGLGAVTLEPGAEGHLEIAVATDVWVHSITLSASDGNAILVKEIHLDGLPQSIGDAGAPLSLFDAYSTRFGISFGRRFVRAGAMISVRMVNCDVTCGHMVSGGVLCSRLWTEEEMAANAAGFAKLAAESETPDAPN